MARTILRQIRQLLDRLVVRVVLIASLAVLALLTALVAGPLIPDWAAEAIGSRAVDTILNILAASMLTVTTFSLSVMTGAQHFAAAQVTPRSRLVMRNDTVTHSVLASFVGAFVFALIAIILRATPFMGEKESVVLFGFTCLVVLIVIAAILRWIEHLETLGAVDRTVTDLEDAALVVIRNFARRPALGGQAISRDDLKDRPSESAIRSVKTGYVQQIFEDTLEDQAEDSDIDLYVAIYPGDYVLRGEPLVYATNHETLDEAATDMICGAFDITDTRMFEQDALLAVTVLAEVASRALSPGVNDPQTAIDVVHRLTGVLLEADPPDAEDMPETDNRRVYMVPPSLDDLYVASFDVIARDGGDIPELRAAMDAALVKLADMAGPDGQAAARACRARVSAQG